MGEESLKFYQDLLDEWLGKKRTAQLEYERARGKAILSGEKVERFQTPNHIKDEIARLRRRVKYFEDIEKSRASMRRHKQSRKERLQSQTIQ